MMSGLQRAVDVGGVDDDLLVVHHGEELGAGVLREPRVTRAGDQQRGGTAEAGDLFLPLALQRSGTHHQHARNVVAAGAAAPLAAIAWIVLPSPMSSASSARSPKARCSIPSR